MIFFLKKESKMIALLVKSKIFIFIYHTVMFRSLEVYQRSWNKNVLLFTVICVQAYVGLKSR